MPLHQVQQRRELGRFHGLLQIVRFNWPFYLIASVAIALSTFLSFALPFVPIARIVLIIGNTTAAYWIVASLVASHWIYDRSRLCRWDWIAATLPSRRYTSRSRRF